MNSVALILTLVSALMHGTRDFVTKRAFDKEVFILWYEFISILIFAPLAGFIVWRDGIPPSSALSWCVYSALCHMLYWVCMARALDRGDLSLVYPIMRASPAVVLIGSMLAINESVSISGALGVLLVVFGVYILHLRQSILPGIIAPIRALGRDQATRWAFLTMLFVAGYSLLDKVGVSHVHPVLYVFLINAGAFVLYAPLILYSKSPAVLFEEWQRGKASIIANGFLLIFGYVLILFAYTLERVSYVQAVRQVSVLVAFLWGKQFLKEGHWRTRLTAACLVTVGTMMIALAG